jgi:hypothetical protein
MAQQIAASPAICKFLLARTKRGNHQNNWVKLSGLSVAPIAIATVLQTYFADVHPKKVCDMVLSWWKN